MDRRKFLQISAASAGMLPLSAPSAASSAPADRHITGYGTLGRTGLRISDISFGTSQLRSGEEALVHYALDKGINYFDTADSYTGGRSETVLGHALKGVRNDVVIVSKTKVWADDTQQQMMRALEGSLRRLQTDHVDVYFNHAVNDVARMQNPEWFEFTQRAKREGKIRFTGMSGHAGHLVDVVDHVVDNDLVDVLLVAYNFGQDPAFYESVTRSFNRIATHAGLPGVLARAKAKDIGVVAMKTLMGGRLNDMRPYEQPGSTYAQAAFRWTLANPDVDALVISMTSKEKIDEYVGASGSAAVSSLDVDLLRRYVQLNGATYCRQACNDCAGACPFGVSIADVLRTRMYATDYQNLEFARNEYRALSADAGPCLSCSGEPCASACSHGLAVNKLCAPTHRMLA